jgi:hypothetical protein
MRRPELLSARRDLLDLNTGTLPIAVTLISVAGRAEESDDKRDAGVRTVSLAESTVAALRTHLALRSASSAGPSAPDLQWSARLRAMWPLSCSAAAPGELDGPNLATYLPETGGALACGHWVMRRPGMVAACSAASPRPFDRERSAGEVILGSGELASNRDGSTPRTLMVVPCGLRPALPQAVTLARPTDTLTHKYSSRLRDLLSRQDR